MTQDNHWIPEEEYQRIQKTLPIACVDILPIKVDEGVVSMVGLIKRHTPHQGDRWCVIGGRLRYGESLYKAIHREMRSALGDDMVFSVCNNGMPINVYQYMPCEDENQLHDPRKHAISIMYLAEVSGDIYPANEALDFEWTPVIGIKDRSDIGFGQTPMILECLDIFGLIDGGWQ